MKGVWIHLADIVSGKKAPGKIYTSVWFILAIGWLYCAFFTNLDVNLIVILGVFIAILGITFKIRFIFHSK